MVLHIYWVYGFTRSMIMWFPGPWFLNLTYIGGLYVVRQLCYRPLLIHYQTRFLQEFHLYFLLGPIYFLLNPIYVEFHVHLCENKFFRQNRNPCLCHPSVSRNQFSCLNRKKIQILKWKIKRYVNVSQKTNWKFHTKHQYRAIVHFFLKYIL